MITIGITGTIGAGKGTIVEYLKTRGFMHFSVREALIIEIKKQGLEPTRDVMRQVGDELRKISPSYIMERIIEVRNQSTGHAVIESQRALAEVNYLKKSVPLFYLFAVDADQKIRYDRILLRKSSTDNISFEKFKEQEASEMNNTEPWQMNLKACIAQADYVFDNNGTVEELYTKVEEVLGCLEG